MRVRFMRLCTLLLICVLSGAVTGSGTAAYLVHRLLVPGQQSQVTWSDDRATAAPPAHTDVAPGVARLPDVSGRVRGAAAVFAQQLRARVGGSLVMLGEDDGVIRAHWRSDECDWTESEILDLVDAVHREFDGQVLALVGVRECGGTLRRYYLSGPSFARFHEGHVSRPEVLRYLIDVHSEG